MEARSIIDYANKQIAERNRSAPEGMKLEPLLVKEFVGKGQMSLKDTLEFTTQVHGVTGTIFKRHYVVSNIETDPRTTQQIQDSILGEVVAEMLLYSKAPRISAQR